MKKKILITLIPALLIAASYGQDSASTDTCSKKDTVYIAKNGNLDLILGDVNHTIKKLSKGIDKSRKHGFGGGGGPTPGLIMLKMKPVALLTGTDNLLRDKTFNIDWGWDPFYFSGGMGYGGVGQGVRIGGGGWGGKRRYMSEPYGAARDSVVQLDVNVGYGGLLIEKAIVKEQLNYVMGCLVGGGAIRISRRFLEKESASAFVESAGADSPGTAQALMFVFEMHGGGTYTLLPWFHLGADANAALFYSNDGFDGPAAGFVTVNPGVKIRIIFGNIG
jgi:hypothetical protein